MKRFLELPGDKSLSHRVAMLAALAAGGSCRIDRFNQGADCRSTVRCLEQLGVHLDGNLRIQAPEKLIPPGEVLDCGNSGSTIRFLQGLLAGQDIPATLTGDDSLRRRPMKRVAEPLRMMGAVIHLHNDDFAPVRIVEGVKRAIEYRMPISSAQVKTAILFAGLRFPGTRVEEPLPSRDHTERLFAFVRVQGGTIPAFQYSVPADPSAAAFFLIAAILKQIDDVCFPGVLVNPHRIGFLRILQKAGARLALRNERILQNEPVADIHLRSSNVRLEPIRIEPPEVPSVIDEIPVLSILGTHCGFSVHGASELRHKESDRIHAMVSNLNALGIPAREHPDGYTVSPGAFHEGVAKTFGDHRIAMTFAAAGIPIDDPECVSISLPEFFSLLQQLES